MTKIIVIGTLHAGLTPRNELKQMLEIYDPDQVLVEVTPEAITSKRIHSYPPEMIFSCQWAIKRGKHLNCFDATMSTWKKGFTKKENNKVILGQKKLMKLKHLRWNDMNKPKNLKVIQTDSAKKLVDLNKEREREAEMLNNIKKHMIRKGTVMIITGCGHLDFFQKHLKKAVFPLR